MTALAYISISELRDRFNSGELSAVDLLQDCMDRHQRWQSHLNAYHLWDEQQILHELDSRRTAAGQSSSRNVPALLNIPFSVKSVIAADNYAVFAGTSRALPDGFVTQGEVIDRLKMSGAVVSGITHAAEFAVGGLGANQHWPIPRNPWDTLDHRLPGGSSSGAAVSVWEGSCVFAVGTDTGGSVRVPASAAGLAGLKTTSGRWSLSGVVPLAHRFDSIGVIAHRVTDLIEVFNAIDGDEKVAPQESGFAGFSVSRASDVCWEDLDPGIAEVVDSAINELCLAGMPLQADSSPIQQQAMQLRNEGKPNSAAIECGAMLHGELIDYLPGVGRHVRKFIDSEANRSEADHQARIDEIALFQSMIREQQSDNEIILCPTLRNAPPTMLQIEDPEIYSRFSDSLLHNTVIPSMCKQCAVTIPVGLDSQGLPVGLQIIAPSGCDASLLRFARQAEQVLGCALERLGVPPLLAPGTHRD